MLARQIRGLPVQEAITQMEFSNKRVSSKILHNLAFARTNAEKQKGIVPKNLVVGTSNTLTPLGAFFCNGIYTNSLQIL